tara:strand:- start:328 stop:528 length:201 start_codon:yes stop_codon:yes gene_type:complete
MDERILKKTNLMHLYTLMKRLERKIDVMRADFLSQNNHRKHDMDEMMLLLYKIKEELGLGEQSDNK